MQGLRKVIGPAHLWLLEFCRDYRDRLRETRYASTETIAREKAILTMADAAAKDMRHQVPFTASMPASSVSRQKRSAELGTPFKLKDEQRKMVEHCAHGTGAIACDYAMNWTKDQFEGHLEANGYTSSASGRVTVWSDHNGAKVFTTRDFSKSGGSTGELFHSTQKSPVAKFRFDQTPGP